MSEAKGGRMRRRALLSLILLLAGAAVAAGGGGAAPPLPRYTLVDLTPHLEETGFAQALDFGKQGTAVGALPGEEGGSEAAAWPGGEPLFLGTLGGSTSVAHGGNKHGRIVGDSLTTGDTAVRAFAWDPRGAALRDLGTLGGESSWARDVDDAGVVVGGAEAPGGAVRPFRWERGQMADLGTLGGTTGWADAIGARGEIVGASALPGDEAVRATLWLGSLALDLGTLGGRSSWARDVDSRGYIAGWAELADGTTHAFLRARAAMVDLGTLGGTYSAANGVNRHGQVVGVAMLPGDVASAGFLFSNGELVALDSLLVDGDGWSVIEAFEIDDRGRIAAQATRGGATHAVVLEPAR